MAQVSAEERIAAAVGKIPSGLSILTAADGERSTAMLASWIQQASFEPLMVTVCVKKDRPIESLIDASSRFVLNIVGSEAKSLLKHFGRGFAPDEDAFKGLSTTRSQYGVLLNDAIAHIECTVSEKLTAGDHFIYLGEAREGNVVGDSQPYVHIRKSGGSY